MQIQKLLLPIACAASLFVLNGCMVGQLVGMGHQVKGSGKLKTESRKVGAFTKIESAGPFDITVKIGKTQSVSVSADDNLLPIIKTEVNKGTLVIGSKENFSSHNTLKVTITVPALDAMSLTGSGDTVLSGLNSKSLDLEITGSGTIKASGKASTLQATITGSGDITATELSADKVTANVTGSGDIQIRPIRSLTAQISGSGDIVYVRREGLSVTKNVAGSGEVRAK